MINALTFLFEFSKQLIISSFILFLWFLVLNLKLLIIILCFQPLCVCVCVCVCVCFLPKVYYFPPYGLPFSHLGLISVLPMFSVLFTIYVCAYSLPFNLECFTHISHIRTILSVFKAKFKPYVLYETFPDNQY